MWRLRSTGDPFPGIVELALVPWALGKIDPVTLGRKTHDLILGGFEHARNYE
jgi:hypothetical protein